MSLRGATTPLRRLLLVGPAVAMMAAIFLASSSSNPPAPPGVSDKILHMGAYAALAVLIFRALSGGLPARLTRAAVVATLLITIGYGVTDEVHQMFVPQRSPELYDLFADAAGAVAGLIACWAWAIIQIPDHASPPPNPTRRR